MNYLGMENDNTRHVLMLGMDSAALMSLQTFMENGKQSIKLWIKLAQVTSLLTCLDTVLVPVEVAIKAQIGCRHLENVI